MSEWIAEAVGKMHMNRITQKDVATKMGVSEDYVSMILRGVRDPKGAQERIESAINEIIAEQQK